MTSCDQSEQPLYCPTKGCEVYTTDGAPLVLAELLAECEPEKPDDGPHDEPSTIDPTAEQVEDMRSALPYLNPDDRPTWIKVRACLREWGAAGFDLFDTWAKTSSKYKRADVSSWATQGHSRAGYKGIFKAAMVAGWPNPRAGSWGGAHDPCSHLANAYRISKKFGDRLLYVENVGWHTFQPPWRLDELGARKLVHGLGKIIAQEAAGMAGWVADTDDKREREEREAAMNRRFKWAGHSEAAPNIESSLRLSQSLLSCRADVLDANPMLLGLPNGVLELDTGTHRAHRQTDRLTKTTGCDFDPQAAAPQWARFIGEIMGNDAELIDYLQRLAGYMLLGARGEHLLPIFWGVGANGKTTFLGALQAVWRDYASGAAHGLLIQRGGNEHPTGLADLQGKRLVVVSETGEAGRLNEEQAKVLTGGDAVTARRMRMDFYTFQPTHQLLLQTNHRPRVTGTDEGVWRRLRLIPFAITVPKDRRDPRLPEKLRTELLGILAWAFIGWQRYQVEGFNDPAAVRAATSEYREASDAVGAYLDESCEIGAYLTAGAGDLYKDYSQWCEAAGEHARPQREFGMRLTERGFAQTRGAGGIRLWRGLGLAEATRTGRPRWAA